MRMQPVLIGVAVLIIGLAAYFWLVPIQEPSRGKPAPHALDQSAGEGTR